MSGIGSSSAGRRNIGVLSVAEVGLGTLACATTTLFYTSYFTGLSYLLPLLTAAAGSAVLATVAALRHWRAGATLLAAVLGFVVLAVFGALTFGVPTKHIAAELGSGLVRGWARMLTVGLPADVTVQLLVTPATITWSAAFLATTLALRTRSVLAPLLPPLVALVVGLLLTASRTDSALPVTAVFLVATLALMLVRSIRSDSSGIDLAAQPDQAQDSASASRPRLMAGRAAFGVPIVLVAVLVGTTGAGLVSTGTKRFDPRDVVPVPLRLNDTVTPLATLKSQLRDPQRQLFTIRIDNGTGAGIDRVRTAILDSFDGALWASDDSFLVAGRNLASGPSLIGARRVTLHVSITQLDGPYLPSVGWPIHVDRSGFGFSSTSGALVTNHALTDLSYDVVGELRPRNDDAMRDAVPNNQVQDRYTWLPPGLPPDIRKKGADLTSTPRTPYLKLVAIETYLQKLPYSLDARPGHSYDALRRLFSADPHEQVGYAEQFASAFAILARSQGFPTRVAVGYLLNPDHRRDNTYTVMGGDAHAWAEVNLTGYGWVVFDPTNPARTPVPPGQKPPDPGLPDPSANPGNGESQLHENPNLRPGGAETSLLAWPLLPLTLFVVLLVLVPAVIAGEKIRRRRQRRRSGSSAAQIVGAWRETTDRLVEHGVEVPQSLTAQQVAQQAEQQLGEPAAAVAVLAPIVTKAIFCPIPPDDDTVREAWELDAQLSRDLRRVDGPLGRVRSWLDPRPLIAGRQDRRRRRRSWERLQGG